MAVKKGGSKGKQEKVKKEGRKLSALYETSGDSIKRKNRTCPKCGPGMFMGKHKDRLVCGKCTYTEYESKSSKSKSSEEVKEEKKETKEKKTEVGKKQKEEAKEKTKKAIEKVPEKEIKKVDEAKKEAEPVEKADAHRKQQKVITQKTGQVKSRV